MSGTAREDATSVLADIRGRLSSAPNDIGLLLKGAQMALGCGLFQESEEFGRRAIDIGEEPVLSRQLYAHALLAQHRFDEAQTALREAFEVKADANIAQDLAYALWRSGRHQSVVDFVGGLDEATGLPVALAAYHLRALHALGELEQARSIFESLRARHPMTDDALGVASLIYFDLDLFDPAGAVLKAIGRPEAMNLEALVTSGYLALRRQALPEAQQYFNAALTRNPKDGRSLVGCGMLKMMSRDLPAAEEQLLAGATSLASHIGSWLLLGWCQLLQGNFARADASFNKALSIDDNFGDTHGSLAALAAMQGDRDRAEGLIKLALRLNASSAPARYARLILDGKGTDQAALSALIGQGFMR